MEFYYKFLKNDLPHVFKDMILSINNEIHHHSARISSQFHLPRLKHTFAKNCIRYSLPILLNNTPECIKEKLYTHSLNGFTYYIKNHTINKYSSTCIIVNCYICGNH